MGFGYKISIYLILQKNVKFEKVIFKMKMIFIKPRNLILKYFLNN